MYVLKGFDLDENTWINAKDNRIIEKLISSIAKRIRYDFNFFLRTSHFNIYKPTFSIQNKKAVSKIANVITTNQGLTFNN